MPPELLQEQFYIGTAKLWLNYDSDLNNPCVRGLAALGALRRESEYPSGSPAPQPTVTDQRPTRRGLTVNSTSDSLAGPGRLRRSVHSSDSDRNRGRRDGRSNLNFK